MRRLTAMTGALCAALALATTTMAQEFPSKQVLIVVPFLAGGSVDAMARIFGAKLGDYWGKPVVVEDKPGAGGTVGSLSVAQAAPDGHTLLFAPGGPLSYNAILYPNLPYDPATAFAHVTVVASSANFLIVGKDSKFNSLAAIIAAAKAAPGKLNYGSQGNGTGPHLAGAMLVWRAGVDITHVPYRGFPPLLADLVTGQIDIHFGDTPNTLPQLRNGQVRVLASATPARSPVIPDAPTMAEAGLKDFVSIAWFSLVAPAKTPPAVVAKIHADTARALKDPDVVARFAPLGLEGVGSSPEETRKLLAGETERWGEVIRAAGIKVE